MILELKMEKSVEPNLDKCEGVAKRLVDNSK